YSTWTPAPPYTSGGYSRVSSAIFIRRLRVDDGALLDHDDPVRGDREAEPVGVGIDTDPRPVRDANALVEDRVPDDRPAPDVRAVHDDGVLDERVRVHVHPGREDRAAHGGARDDDAGADHRVHRDPHPARVLEDELRRWQLLRPREDRPLGV